MPRHSRWTLAITGLYAVGLALVGLWPTHIDKNFAIAGWPSVQWVIRHLELTPQQGYNMVEFSANVLLFIPLGALILTFRPRWSWVRVILAGAIVSTAIEILQEVSRPGRTADLRDVLANTIGTAVGLFAVIGLRRILALRE